MTQPVDEFRAAQEKEYGTYVATGDILVGGVLAFLAGHAVPVSHVENGVVDKSQVAKRDTKAGKAVTGQES